MVAPDHDRRTDLSGRDEIIDRDAEFRAVALPQPTDARRQSLKMNFLFRFFDPRYQMRISGEQFESQRIDASDIARIARQGGPAERPLPFAEKRADVFRHEARNGKRIGEPGIEGHGPDIVAIVERDRAAILHGAHRAYVLHGALGRTHDILFGIAPPEIGRRFECHARRDVSGEHIVRTRLIGHHIRRHTAFHKFRQYLGGIADETYGEGVRVVGRISNPRQRFVE